MSDELNDVEPPIAEQPAYPAVLQAVPEANVRLKDGTKDAPVPYIAYWRSSRQYDFPPEDEARQGWYEPDAARLVRECPFVELIEPLGRCCGEEDD